MLSCELLWRVRQVASALRGLPREGAAYIDHRVALIAHRISPARLRHEVILGEAVSAPDAAVARARAAADARSVGLYPSHTADGLMDLFGRMDYVEAQDLEAALQMVAAELREAVEEGCSPSPSTSAGSGPPG